MIYNTDLEELIFHRHEHFPSDELIILSGYVGPNPIDRLRELDFPKRVIYGMYGSDGIKEVLHTSLIRLNDQVPDISIFYSNLPVHSKCYIWKNHGEIINALIGSANFSDNGLRTPYREILAETNRDSFRPLDQYITQVLNNCIDCREGVVRRGPAIPIIPEDIAVCNMTLLDPRTNEVQNANGLNWGQNPLNHTNRSDANIPIRADYIRRYPTLFPPKHRGILLADAAGRIQRHNDSIEIIWDDGVTMRGLLEGNVIIDNILYPKQIASFPEKMIA